MDWVPNQRSRYQLRQCNLSAGQINDLIHDYLLVSDQPNDQEFLSYSLRKNIDSAIAVTQFPANWKPSKSVVTKLVDLGIPKSKVENDYLGMHEVFIKEQSKHCISWDQHYIVFCQYQWDSDPENALASIARPILSSWQPSAASIESLLARGYSHRDVELSALEFRMYWRDRGGVRIDWDESFMDWAMSEGVHNS